MTTTKFLCALAVLTGGMIALRAGEAMGQNAQDTTQLVRVEEDTPAVAAAQQEVAAQPVAVAESAPAAPKSGKLTKEEKAAQEKAAKEEKLRLKAEKAAQEKAAKEEKKRLKAEAEARKKQEKLAAKGKAVIAPVAPETEAKLQQLEKDIAELKRMQEELRQQLELYTRNQSLVLEAVKAAQEASAEAVRTAQAATQQSNIEKNKAAEKKAAAAARKEANSLIFRIQISARRSRVDVNDAFDKFGLGMKVMEERHEDDNNLYIYKYVVGSFRQVDAAIEACNEVRGKGIKDAFVVAYHKGSRITMADAFNMLSKN